MSGLNLEKGIILPVLTCAFQRGRGLGMYLIVFCQLALLVGVFLMSGTARAGEISVLAPAGTSMDLLSRNRIINVIVKVTDQADLDRLSLRSVSGRSYDALGRYEKDGVYYVHYRLSLKKGRNNFMVLPANRQIKIKYTPLSSLLNADFTKPGLYLFHRNETIPAVCAGCHTKKIPGDANVNPVRYGQFSPECYSCHSSTAVGAEWKHFPSFALLCRSCHQADSSKDQIIVPAGKVESLCFNCHVNQSKWLSMKHIHGPVGTGDCTICHDPHGSNSKGQLWADGRAKLCVVCHQDKAKFLDVGNKKFEVHGILNAQGCIACHSPHATNYRFQLYQEISDLCVSCHNDLAGMKYGHPVFKHPLKGISDPNRKGRSLSCTSCHNPHGSEFDNLLIGNNRGGRICLKCHKNSKNARNF